RRRLFGRDKFHPPVLRTAGARAIRRHRMRLAVALGAQAIAAHAALDERQAHRIGALAAQLQVHVGRTDVVGVALDADAPDLGVLLDHGRDLIEQLLRALLDARRARLEVDLAE